MVAQFINSLKFNKVTTLDAHSYVLEAVVDNLLVVPQWACADRLPLHDVLIAPDAGAAKKIFTLNMVACAKVEVLIANKTRHANGAVTTTLDGCQRALGKRVCVVDDLCDGGATFLSLAEILLENCRFAGGEPAELNLYVTHGFFTKGVETLLAFYDNIYVHNNFNKSVADKIKEI
jgi:ribose-phosphate pyrophosphokinase